MQIHHKTYETGKPKPQNRYRPEIEQKINLLYLSARPFLLSLSPKAQDYGAADFIPFGFANGLEFTLFCYISQLPQKIPMPIFEN